jgi:aryl-alcohol dehydrogenase-like predicted oxidoreductase
MNYRLLGRSGLRVSEFALGTMTFGEEWGWGASKDESKRIFDLYVEKGGNFIDTANRYTDGTSEKYCGEFIAADREHFVLATKYTLNMRTGDPSFSGNHKKNMVQSVEASLKRLNTEFIDLLWLHAWDFTTPVDEVMRGLDDLIRMGKILYIGISDTPAWIVSHANTLAELKGWTQFTALQIQYSLTQRTVERDLLPMARHFDLAVTPWGTLDAGILTGKYNKNSEEKGRANRLKAIPEDKLKIADEVIKVAEEAGISPSQAAISWVRQQPGIIIPILGARTAAHLKDNLDSLEHIISEEHMQKLNDISRIDLGFPHEFLASDPIQEVVFGGTQKKLINHRRK